MMSALYSAILGVLPAAIAALPAFIAMPISAIMVKLALRTLPYPEGARETLEPAADKVLHLGITCVALFCLTLMAAANMAAYDAQSAFDAPMNQRR